MPTKPQIFRVARSRLVFAGFVCCVFTIAFTFVIQHFGQSLVALLIGGLTLFTTLNFVDNAITRVEISGSKLMAIANFNQKTFDRALIESLIWEPGQNVMLHMANGSRVRLPSVKNNELLATSIRAWLDQAR